MSTTQKKSKMVEISISKVGLAKSRAIVSFASQEEKHNLEGISKEEWVVKDEKTEEEAIAPNAVRKEICRMDATYMTYSI